MNLPIPEIRVGPPMCCEGLAVFPLYAGRSSLFAPEYVLAHEAMALGTVTVREVSSVGSVPDLLVENRGDLPCLILEGTELRGQKQHRMLNTTALVGGRSEARIPVSCVEHGRWRQESPAIRAGSHCPPVLAAPAEEAPPAAAERGLGSRQTAVWAEIRRRHRALGVTSTTEDLSGGAGRSPRQDKGGCRSGCRTRRGKRGRRRPRRQARLHRHPRQAGDPGKDMESFDRRDGAGHDREPGTGREATGRDVRAVLQRMRRLDWHSVKPVGLGDERRAGDDGMLAGALVFGEVMLHASAASLLVRHDDEIG